MPKIVLGRATHDNDKIVVPFPPFLLLLLHASTHNNKYAVLLFLHILKRCHSLKMNRFRLNRFGFGGIVDDEERIKSLPQIRSEIVSCFKHKVI